MKTIRLLLLLICVISFVGCEPEPICGSITGKDIEYVDYNPYYDTYNVNYVLYVNGYKRYVDAGTYSSYFLGSYICLE